MLDFALRMTGDHGFKRFGDIGDGVYIVELAGGHDGGEQGPFFGPDFMTGEERVFSALARPLHSPPANRTAALNVKSLLDASSVRNRPPPKEPWGGRPN